VQNRTHVIEEVKKTQVGGGGGGIGGKNLPHPDLKDGNGKGPGKKQEKSEPGGGKIFVEGAWKDRRRFKKS